MIMCLNQISQYNCCTCFSPMCSLTFRYIKSFRKIKLQTYIRQLPIFVVQTQRMPHCKLFFSTRHILHIHIQRGIPNLPFRLCQFKLGQFKLWEVGRCPVQPIQSKPCPKNNGIFIQHSQLYLVLMLSRNQKCVFTNELKQ